MITPAVTTRRWVLIGSLALNLFLIGFLAIGFFRHHEDHDRPPRPFYEMMRFMQTDAPGEEGRSAHFLKHMPDQDRDALITLREKHGPALSRAKAETWATRARLRDLMQNGVRDPEQLTAALRQTRDAQTRYFDETNALLLDIAGSLSDEGYKMLAEKRRPEPK
ncbi:MAG: hypothetical protein CMM78_09555 [Rhodospirillaceae bacterium]|jgi:uncharacterized membrane protein|uniref:periplasmic heavy metal sensor n=1 Tax=unclassified Hwanghaeella TaxID=2605944 RepID=UPI000C399895|nr:hypothetical protein [Rhodospirillales bacterium]MAX48440.1 hypothetical protein [Rhodospirillaceae bacterium]|tara:strand:+ start:2354 stop:2845 length:492 start_codon:yes stop_codon:yes gene_type:complete